MSSAQAAKFNMIEQQIRPWEVLDHRVLSTLDAISREDFVPEPYRGLAYADCQIPLPGGNCMLLPTIEGRLLQALLIEPDDDALLVGCAGGYVAACLAHLARQVTCIDASPENRELASRNLTDQGFDRIGFESTSLAAFDQPDSYDVIAVTASLATTPENLRQALKLGGRLFVVTGQAPVMQALLINRVSESEWTTQSLFETVLPRLNG